MRIFMQQERVMCDFNTADSWVILSPIEQSIKRKIEAVGIPLKDWDINIYRGVLTGCNEAFIINSTKRKEILANCQSAEEKERTEELIRLIFPTTYLLESGRQKSNFLNCPIRNFSNSPCKFYICRK